MLPITVLTATYNHPDKLKNLYESLIKQDDLNFSWIIINDGSGQETKELIEGFQRDAILDIVAYHQENGGKSKAINRGLELLKEDTSFFVIIDDDERLYSDAITTIKRYFALYNNTECGVIHFNRKNEQGIVIADPYFREDFFMSYQEHKGKGYHADGYLGYFTKKLGEICFSIYPEEKYIAPSTLIMKVTRESTLLWASAVLGETEYLAGGITKQGRRLRIKNPQGMIEYCELMQENGAVLKTRLAYSTQGFAYSFFLNNKAQVRSKSFFIFTKPLGYLLSKIWESKYVK